MSQVEIGSDEVSLDVSNNVEITTSATEASVNTSTTKIVELIPNNYVISSSGIYSSNAGVGAIPDWLQSAIDQGIIDNVDGKIDIDRLEESLRTLIQGLESGVNQNISEIATATAALSSLTTSVNASIGANEASILAIEAAYVNEEESTALTIEALQSVFGGTGTDVEATSWFTDLNSSTASSVAANSNSLNAVAATINDVTTGTVATSQALSDLYSNVGVDPVTGVFSAAGHTQDLAAAIGVDGGELAGSSGLHNTLYVNTERVETNFSYNANTWINGSYYDAGFGLKTVAGGSGTNGDPYNSEFWIDANRFKFSDGTTGHDVFVADANGVTFNGVVNFNNISGTPTHTSGIGSPSGVGIEGSTYRNNTDSSLWSYTAGAWTQAGNPDAVVASEVAAAVNNNTTKIDGNKIVTGTLFSQNISFTGKITGGSGGLGGIIQSEDYSDGVSGMKIDLIQGTFYIA